MRRRGSADSRGRLGGGFFVFRIAFPIVRAAVQNEIAVYLFIAVAAYRISGIALSEDPRDHVLGVCAVYRLFRCSINYSGVGHNGERAEKGGEHLRKACSAPEFFRRTDKTFLTGFTSSRNFCVHICLPHTEFSLA